MEQRSAGPAGTPQGDRHLVGSLLHGLSILDMFDRGRRVVGIGEMAKQLGLHKSSASRLAATLAAAGYLQPTETAGQYRLGMRLAAVGQLAAEELDVERLVVPHLAHLTDVTGETGHLAVLQGPEARTIAVTDGWHTVRMHSWVGKTNPAYTSSMGKIILAGLDEDEIRGLYPNEDLPRLTDRTVGTVTDLLGNLATIRSNGFGYDNEEVERGLRCVSAPILGPDGAVIAGLSVSAPTSRFTSQHIPLVARHVRWNAAQASRALGHRTGFPETWGPDAFFDEPEPLPWVEDARPTTTPPVAARA